MEQKKAEETHLNNERLKDCSFVLCKLAFLSQKYEVAPRLLGILNVLGQTNPKPEVDKTVKILKATSSQELPAD